MCSDTLNPRTILDANPSLAVVPVRVVLTERLVMDAVARTCMRQLVESVTVQLANQVLRHSAQGDYASFPYEQCVALAAQSN